VLVNSGAIGSPGTTGAGIQINSTGFYQVTFGVIPNNNADGWDLTIGTTSANGLRMGGSTGVTTSLSVIVEITTSGTILSLINDTGAARNLTGITTASGGAGTIAFMTIVKLL
jgi:hypothetical protein